MAAGCHAPRAVHTVGHSTRAIETLLDLLSAHSIARVVDVRRWPASRRHPQFAREALARSLASREIEYDWRGDLGGFRKAHPDSPNTGWREPSFRAYADFMLTRDFESAIASVEAAAAAQRIALLCAEAVPWRCHRQLLADALTVRNWPVRHLMDDTCHLHALTAFARATGVRIVYSVADLFTVEP